MNGFLVGVFVLQSVISTYGAGDCHVVRWIVCVSKMCL